MKLFIRTGINAGKNPSLASVYQARADADRGLTTAPSVRCIRTLDDVISTPPRLAIATERSIVPRGPRVCPVSCTKDGARIPLGILAPS